MRSTPGKLENGPAFVTRAMLTRQSNVASPAPSGETAISVVSPPPFFQGMRPSDHAHRRSRSHRDQVAALATAYQRSAAVCTGASHRPRSSSSSAVTVSEQPAMSSEVQ